MQQTLLRIPLDAPWSLGPFGQVPGFGFGMALALWIAVAALWVYRHRAELRLNSELVFPVGLWLVVAVAIVKAPAWVHRQDQQVVDAASAVIDAHRATADVYLARGRARQSMHQDSLAVEDFQKAASEDPKLADGPRDLAWLYATSPDESVRDGQKALAAAQEMSKRTKRDDAWTLDVEGAALAESGKFDEAISAAPRAATLAVDSHDPYAATRLQGIRERLSTYQDHRPWRESRVGKAIPVYGYGFMLFLGFIAAGWTATRRAQSVGISADIVWDAALWLFFSGIAGARLFYLLQYSDRVFANRPGLVDKLIAVVNLPDGGLVLYGGVLLAIAVGIWYCRRNNVNAQKLGDVLIPSLFLGVAFGRMGCFLNGCCYGDRCELPWGVTFPVGSVPDMALVTRGYLAADQVIQRIALHPTQVYSAIDGLILYLFTATYFRYRPRDGAVTIVALLTYPVTRFFIEYLRSDEPPVLVHVRPFILWGKELFQVQTPFTISQWVSVGMFAAGLVYLWWWSRPKRAASVPAQAPRGVPVASA